MKMDTKENGTRKMNLNTQEGRVLATNAKVLCPARRRRLAP